MSKDPNKTLMSQPEVPVVPVVPNRIAAGNQVPHCAEGWILQERIGNGSIGEVWCAKRDNVLRVFKFCLNNNENYEAQIVSIKLEFKVLNTLKNRLVKRYGPAKYIVQLQSWQLEKEPYWLSFDYFAGGTLKELITEHGMPWSEAWTLFEPILKGAAQMHEMGIVHLDLKPANILLINTSKPYYPLVADFGVAQILDDGQERPFLKCGTIPYRSPNQAQDITATAQDDVYSLGVILWLLLSGKFPDRILNSSKSSSEDVRLKDQDIDSVKVAEPIKVAIQRCLQLTKPPFNNAGELLEYLSNNESIQKPVFVKPDYHAPHLTFHEIKTSKHNLKTYWNNFSNIKVWRYVIGTVVTFGMVILVWTGCCLPIPKKICSLVPDIGTLPGRFVKIDNNGQPLPDNARSWSCVRDTVTCVVWEVKTADGGLQDQKRTYTWGNPDSTSDRENINTSACSNETGCDTLSYVAAVNNQRLCGASDWRIPEREELHSIIDYGRSNPSTDIAWFRNTPSSEFWSASPLYCESMPSNGSNMFPWTVNFSDGRDISLPQDDNHVRLVRTEN